MVVWGINGWQGANTPLMIMHFSTGAKNHNLPEDCLLSNAVAPVLHVLMQGQVNVRLEAADPAMNLVCAVCSNTSPQFHDDLQLVTATTQQVFQLWCDSAPCYTKQTQSKKDKEKAMMNKHVIKIHVTIKTRKLE